MQCEIARQFFEMMALIASEQKVPREYGGTPLYHAELGLLDQIEEFPESNVSALSSRCGVTKSAVTQLSARLMEKGLIERYQSPRNKKERFFRLTDAGRQARQAYAEENQKAAGAMRRYLCGLSAEEKKTIVSFMAMMKTYIPVGAFPCHCQTGGSACFLQKEKG